MRGIDDMSATTGAVARERYISIDAVRGFAVLGILLMNIVGMGLPAFAILAWSKPGWRGSTMARSNGPGARWCAGAPSPSCAARTLRRQRLRPDFQGYSRWYQLSGSNRGPLDPQSSALTN
jgi:predicted acyltransferase